MQDRSRSMKMFGPETTPHGNVKCSLRLKHTSLYSTRLEVPISRRMEPKNPALSYASKIHSTKYYKGR
ncbi:hypothetical protein SERLA73DRAFT_183677 [Serpula lacrymans var. lacrymans S7.3]|uniref:Uncharacterized protein n=2 Tax=Serpula lacrymans var. lacrymans TaxID=341189 RepID=F8Q0E5_SERL3|nr:hypothetical protein SERLA73DRAFT_183677 [Serpula lacrymans var. lacrymans S7.3]